VTVNEGASNSAKGWQTWGLVAGIASVAIFAAVAVGIWCKRQKQRATAVAKPQPELPAPLAVATVV
jgi:hypothetical protein